MHNGQVDYGVVYSLPGPYSLLSSFLESGPDIAPGWIATGTITPTYLQSIPCRARMWTRVEPVGVATLNIRRGDVDLLRGCCLIFCD